MDQTVLSSRFVPESFHSFLKRYILTSSKLIPSIRKFTFSILINGIPINIPLRRPSPKQLSQRFPRSHLRPTLSPPLQRTFRLPPPNLLPTPRILLQLAPSRNLVHPMRPPRDHQIHPRIPLPSSPNCPPRNPTRQSLCHRPRSPSRRRGAEMDRSQRRTNRRENVCAGREASARLLCGTFSFCAGELCCADAVEGV